MPRYNVALQHKEYPVNLIGYTLVTPAGGKTKVQGFPCGRDGEQESDWNKQIDSKWKIRKLQLCMKLQTL